MNRRGLDRLSSRQWRLRQEMRGYDRLRRVAAIATRSDLKPAAAPPRVSLARLAGSVGALLSLVLQAHG